jgi:hypothetical protein
MMYWKHEMKTVKFLFLSLCLSALLPFEALACQCGSSHTQIFYDDADAVVLVQPVPETKKTFAVIRSWKSDLPELVTVSGGGACHLRVGEGDGPPILLYLKRYQDGVFGVPLCGGSLLRDFDARVQWLDKVSACGCPSRNVQGWHDQADAVASADIVGIREEGDKKFADLKILLTWKTELPASISVQTEDGCGCGFPVRLEKPQPFRHYLLYLRRDENGQFSTDFCSGNLDPFEYRETAHDYIKTSRFNWLFKQEKPKKPKEPD